MKNTIKNDLPLLAFILLPMIYAGYIWNQLPAKVPMHWDINGEIDRYGNKSELIFIILLPLFLYLIFLVIPAIDPKGKLKQMGNKYQAIKLILVGFMSVLSLFIIYSVKNLTTADPNYIMLLVGVLFIILGNYFKTIKANYFIGIRTPWTLENETVWNATHKLGGKMWFIGGFVIVLTSLMLSTQINIIVSLVIMGIIVIVPIVYSYLKFKEVSQQT